MLSGLIDPRLDLISIRCTDISGFGKERTMMLQKWNLIRRQHPSLLAVIIPSDCSLSGCLYILYAAPLPPLFWCHTA